MKTGFKLVAACALAATGSSASAQQAADQSEAPVVVAPAKAQLASSGALRIPAGTPVTFEIAAPLGSKVSKTGDTFPIRLWEPLRIDGVEVLPKGTAGTGEVIHAARARAAGKAGELILAARTLEFNGQQIKLRSFKMGAQPQTGESNSTTAMVVGLVSAPLALFVVGGEIDIPAGTVANAKVAADIEAPASSTATPN